jgi:hypothetical protein
MMAATVVTCVGLEVMLISTNSNLKSEDIMEKKV